MDEQQVEDIVKCSDCGSRNLTRDETRGEVICEDVAWSLKTMSLTKVLNGECFRLNKATSEHVPVRQ